MIGRLKHRIAFQQLVTEVNENGFEAEVWESKIIVWASISNLSGREYYQAVAIQGEKTVKFLIRYIAEIDNSMRILFRDKIYNITYIDNVKYENKYIEIKALEVEDCG